MFFLDCVRNVDNNFALEDRKWYDFCLDRQATFSNLTYLELYTSLQECFDKLVIYHEICSDLFICNYMIVKW